MAFSTSSLQFNSAASITHPLQSNPRVTVSPPPMSTTAFSSQQFDRMVTSRSSALKVTGNPVESVYDDRSKYLGTVVSGLRTGQGKYTYPNGDVYTGMWNQDKFHGLGSYNFGKSGVSYFGEFDGHRMHGKGTLVSNENGEMIYDGAWDNGLKHGYGTHFYAPGGKEYYEGEWVGGIKQGQGMHSLDGNVYRGEWVNNKRHGPGQFQTRNGVVYSGVWNHNVMDGGSIRYPRNGGYQVYEGQLSNGFRHGKGVYKHLDGQVYEGHYLNDMKHGHGVEKKDNAMYTGSFAHDLKHGYGTMTASNGDRYEGQFVEGKKHGPNSFYTWRDGSTFRGSFDNDAMWEGTFVDLVDNIPRTVVKGQVLNS